ncbi:hypothetical protein [Sphingomonas psychrolutea]|uniref:Glutathione S-transferase n=1 Tax=Sphingomonas psychrolutea TaxID=1259676 RepID=A0ABQ1G6F0_9SPHN|nr:hypothetical protein [Sphingomonas psychrolutea]GGA37650.1 hypothetical protein GCM10011395_04960 [Sphingomonas psychrolutea]
MIQFYYHPSPNPAKVALCLEETGLDYAMIPVDTRNGEQFVRVGLGASDALHFRA